MTLFDTIRLENCHASLLAANTVIERYCSRYELDAATRQQLLLILEETLVNIINHGFDDSGKHYIELSIYHEPGNVVLRFKDDGRPFDPARQPMPTLGLPSQDAPVGGLGVYLMQQLAKTIRYQRSGKYNILTLLCSTRTRVP